MYNFFSRGSQFFRGDRGIIRRQHSGGDDKKFTATREGGGCHQNSAESSDPPLDVK